MSDGIINGGSFSWLLSYTRIKSIIGPNRTTEWHDVTLV